MCNKCITGQILKWKVLEERAIPSISSNAYELVSLQFAGILIFVMMKEWKFRIAIVKCPFQKVISQIKASTEN
ncbi:hypothetical protein GQX74_001496 [Glossina fuscipes]|nr:hypothetical protein GQX74_001496 [Glossina fuscipes]